MRSKLLFLIMLIVALAAFCGTASANLIPNPGMEDPCRPSGSPTDWWEWGSDRDGNGGSLEEYLNDGGARYGQWYGHAQSDVGGYANILTPDISVEEGKVYYAGIWVKDVQAGGSNTDVGIEILYFDASDARILEHEHTEPAQVPDNGKYNLISGQTIPIPVGITYVIIGFNALGDSDYHIDDFYLDTTRPSGGAVGVHSPEPADNSKSYPGCIDLKWTKYKGQQGDDLTCKLYWNAGSADVNDNNFESTLELTPLTEPNIYSCVTVVAEKDYYWRVDAEDPNGSNGGVDTLIGPVWYFTTVNSPPDVDAGLKQAQWLPSGGTIEVTFQLDPTVSDDGLPAGSLTYQWSHAGGAGAVSYTPAGGATEAPTVTIGDPSAAGDYTFTLTVNDGSGPVSDDVLIRVHANDTTGLEARYDMEEADTGVNVHDDYSDYDRNPGSGHPNGPPSRRAERMEEIGSIKPSGAGVYTIMLPTGGKLARPVQSPGDTDKGGIQFIGDDGYLEVLNSKGDPNEDAPGGAVRTWADFEDEVSVAAWVKIEEGNFDKAYQSIICNGNTSYRLQQNASSGSVLFNLNLTNEDGDTYEAGAWGSIDIDDGTWHHVMGTYDGTKVALYIDGIEDTSTETEGTINIGNDWLTYGQNLGAINADEDGDGIRDGDDVIADTTFNGVMDEVRIHSIGLPWRSDNPGNPEDAPVTETNARSVISIYRTSDGHLNCGGNYMPGDIDENCYVDMADAKVMAEEWLKCSSIDRSFCDGFWK